MNESDRTGCFPSAVIRKIPVESRDDLQPAYRIGDLIDLSVFSRMLDSYFRATGVPNGLVDLNGELLSLSAGKNACTMFLRKHLDSERSCVESNVAIMRNLRAGCVSGGRCKNGLMDYATPIVIEGKQLATLFLGQVLHEPPDLDFFRAQATRFGFDESTYLEAVKAVPVVSKELLDKHMAFMVEIAHMLAEHGLTRLRQAAMKEEVRKQEEVSQQLRGFLEFSPVAMGWSDEESRIGFVNRAFIQLFAYTLDDLPDVDTWFRLAYPDESTREFKVDLWREAVEKTRIDPSSPVELETDITGKNGAVFRVIVRFAAVDRYRLISFTDITERSRLASDLARSEREFRTLAENSPDPIARYDHKARFVYVNPAFESALGIPAGALYGKRSTEIAGLAQAAFFDLKVNKVIESAREVEFEHEIKTENDEVCKGLVRITPEFDEDGRVVFVQVVTRDITARWRNEQKVQSHNAILEMLARGAALPEILGAIVHYVEADEPKAICSVLLVDKQGKHLLFGAGPNIPKFFRQAIHGQEISQEGDVCGKAAALGQRIIVEDIRDYEFSALADQITNDTRLKACWSEPIFSSAGEVLGTFAIYKHKKITPSQRDLARMGFAANVASIAIEKSYAQDELERRAYSDPLTGLANRRRFMDEAGRELSRSLRHQKDLSILMLDIDRFKRINDSYGHHVGDCVLKTLSLAVRNVMRQIDLPARLGGEEFAVLLPETCSAQATELAERLRGCIAALVVRSDGVSTLQVTVSIGVATLRDRETTVELLLKQADGALYQAKNTGRNRVCVHHAGS